MRERRDRKRERDKRRERDKGGEDDRDSHREPRKRGETGTQSQAQRYTGESQGRGGCELCEGA